MDRPRNWITAAKDFCIRYPAVLSGYIIYGYLFLTIMRFFFRARYEGVTTADVVEIFDALPFMWLLALTLVKIIEYRTKLHESQRQRLITEQTVQLKETQVKTLRQVIMTLQHHVNNPLAIILLAVGSAVRSAGKNPAVLKQLDMIRESAQRIDEVLTKLSETEEYDVVTPSVGIGPMTKL